MPEDYAGRRLGDCDLIDVSMELNSDEESVEYSTEIISWQPEQVLVQINFDDPYEVSQGDKNDQL